MKRIYQTRREVGYATQPAIGSGLRDQGTLQMGGQLGQNVRRGFSVREKNDYPTLSPPVSSSLSLLCSAGFHYLDGSLAPSDSQTTDSDPKLLPVAFFFNIYFSSPPQKRTPVNQTSGSISEFSCCKRAGIFCNKISHRHLEKNKLAICIASKHCPHIDELSKKYISSRFEGRFRGVGNTSVRHIEKKLAFRNI